MINIDTWTIKYNVWDAQHNDLVLQNMPNGNFNKYFCLCTSSLEFLKWR